jgi:hypothetical protein
MGLTNELIPLGLLNDELVATFRMLAPELVIYDEKLGCIADESLEVGLGDLGWTCTGMQEFSDSS